MASATAFDLYDEYKTMLGFVNQYFGVGFKRSDAKNPGKRDKEIRDKVYFRMKTIRKVLDSYRPDINEIDDLSLTIEGLKERKPFPSILDRFLGAAKREEEENKE